MGTRVGVEVWAQELRRLTQAAELRGKAAQKGFANRRREELAYCLSERRTARLLFGRPGAHAQTVLFPSPVVGTGPEGEARRRPRGRRQWIS